MARPGFPRAAARRAASFSAPRRSLCDEKWITQIAGFPVHSFETMREPFVKPAAPAGRGTGVGTVFVSAFVAALDAGPDFDAAAVGVGIAGTGVGGSAFARAGRAVTGSSRPTARCEKRKSRRTYASPAATATTARRARTQ